MEVSRVPFKCIVLFLMVCWYPRPHVSGQTTSTGWSNKQADIYFLLDCSASVWIVDYEKNLKFVADLVSEMDIGPTMTRVGVGVYSETHTLHISIDNTMSKTQLESAIQEAPYLKGNTYISRGLLGIRQEGLPTNKIRPGVPLIGVVFTDGQSRYKQLTADNATQAKDEGIFLFSVGIGSGVYADELRFMASDPKEDFYFQVDDFDQLDGLRHKLSLKMSEVEFLQGDKGTCSENTQVDNVWIFDETVLGEVNTLKVKHFITDVAEGLSMNSGNVRMGMISKTCHEGDIYLGMYPKREKFIAAISTTHKDDEDIATLIEKARRTSYLIENGARLHAKPRMVLVIHTPVKNKRETLREAFYARYTQEIEVFIIRIGTDYDKEYLERLTPAENIVYVPTIDDLQGQGKKDFMTMYCKDL